MRWRTAWLALALMLAAPAWAKPRVASINMCTDQLLLSLADPEQIAGVSHLARSPALSWYWRTATAHKILSGQAEDVLLLRPDMVLTATFVKPQTRDLIGRNGLRIEEFASAATIDEVRSQILRAGALLDQPARAASAIARIDAALARLRATASGNRLSILPLERRGWISGQDSLLTNLLAEAGATNLAAQRFGAGTLLPLERLVTLRPDLLLLSDGGTRAIDQGTALLRHPALAQIAAYSAALVMPDAMTVCAGPMLADAMDHLREELARSSGKSR